MSSESKLTVLVVGAGGNTGFLIATALLDANKYNTYILCRPGSQDKTRIVTLKARGAKVKLGDIINDTVEELEKNLIGVDVVVSAVSTSSMDGEKTLFQAAKNAGVQRVVPSDFGFMVPPGEILLSDMKRKLHSFIEELGVGYTFIEVGWWMDLVLPYPSNTTGILAQRSYTAGGTGKVKVAFTPRIDIGRFVAHIIADPRTLNQTVFCYSDQLTLDEVYDIANRVSGEDLRSKVTMWTKAQLAKQIEDARVAYEQAPSVMTIVGRVVPECYYYMYVRGHNTVEKAKELGALDARALYPDFQPLSTEEYAKLFYKELPDIFYSNV
ncbi:hypothetical protein Clacol_000180 [Clathrus columnatus]|uniref:NmrA-like domain-containing protein n=1 Tax=Clathrus columnatus TaxID=1419009 RepID=A0AAV4ZYP4_9AGAM|nr:hypothetical protein Clacol_000180 [Clathrus columnatus]